MMTQRIWCRSMFGILAITFVCYVFYALHREEVASNLKANNAIGVVEQSISENGSKILTSAFYATSTGHGYGNQLFELVSIIGIAKQIDRVPLLNVANAPLIKCWQRIVKWFPALANVYRTKFIKPEAITKVKFGSKTSIYEDIAPLRRRTEDVLELSGAYMQSYKYFHPVAEFIKPLLQFSEPVKKECKKLADSVIRQDVTPRICIHIRRGDFATWVGFMLPSQTAFTKAAMRYILRNHLKSNYNATAPFPVYILGNDEVWSQKLFNKSIDNIEGILLRTSPNDAFLDWAFGMAYCDVVLLSASASTFGWWLAYLSSPSTHVFYNAEYAQPNSAYYRDNFIPKDFFLSQWTPLRYVAGNDSIIVSV